MPKKKSATSRPADTSRYNKSKPLRAARTSSDWQTVSEKVKPGRVTAKQKFIDKVSAHDYEVYDRTISDALVKPRVSKVASSAKTAGSEGPKKSPAKKSARPGVAPKRK
jgi:hypothetical protein